MISIITVTYNAEREIEKTLKSILEQTSNKFELIIKDANSKDKTLLIVKKYIKFFEQKRISVKIISANDKGIYDGMNQALNSVQNEWVYFLNAGDTFYDKKSLEKIQTELNNDFDIIYGSVNKVLTDKFAKIENPLNLNQIVNGMIFCHQGVIIKSNLMKKEKYNTKYKICADYDFFLKMYLNEKKFKKINVIISNYDLNGYSNNNAIKTLKETSNILKTQEIGTLKTRVYFHYLIFREILKECLKNILSDKIYLYLRKLNFIIKNNKKS